VKLGNNESSQSCSKKVYSGLVVCRTEEVVSVVNVVSGGEMLVMFVTCDGEDTARNISEVIKYYKVRRLEKESKGRNINNRIITYFIENFREKYYTPDSLKATMQINLISNSKYFTNIVSNI